MIWAKNCPMQPYAPDNYSYQNEKSSVVSAPKSVSYIRKSVT